MNEQQAIRPAMAMDLEGGHDSGLHWLSLALLVGGASWSAIVVAVAGLIP